MLTRWNYKLKPNKTQDSLGSEWLITLRKHRNYMLRERKDGYDTNNAKVDEPLSYGYGAFCDLKTGEEFGVCCPLSCPVLKHGVMPDGIELTKVKRKKGEPDQLRWGSFSDIQSKASTLLRKANSYFSRIDSDVLQRNIAKLDAAYKNFWKHERGFPAFKKASTFKSFEYKPGRCKFEVNRKAGRKHRYSRVYLPGIGWMRYFDSRPMPEDAEIRTVTVIHEADGWRISVLLNIPEELPEPKEEINGIRGMDAGINQLASFSDGSFAGNRRFRTNPKTARLFRIRQRRVNRKVKGSNNRRKAGIRVAKLHRKVKNQRKAYLWQVAHQAHRNVDAVSHEDLNVKGMMKRCRAKHDVKGWLPNGQSAKRGLNRAIADASWGNLFAKIGWIGQKKGNHVFKYNPAYSSQECSECHHVSKLNRDGEKFLCLNCGHVDHADTQASRTGNHRVGIAFPPNYLKVPGDSGEFTALSYEPPSNGEPVQVGNPISKQLSLLNPEYLEAIV